MDCTDCPVAFLYWSAIQAAETRSKLKELEDLEEQGLLLKLPCKIGNLLYIIDYVKPLKAELKKTKTLSANS